MNNYELIELWNDFAINVISNDDRGVALCADVSDIRNYKYRLIFYNKAKQEWELNDNECIAIAYSCGEYHVYETDLFLEFLFGVEDDHKKWFSENPDTLPQLMQHKKLFRLFLAITND